MRVRLAVAAVVAVALLAAAGCASAPSAPPAAGGSASASSSADPQVLTVAIAGMVVPQEGFDYYRELSSYVAARAGKELRLIHKADYAQVNTMLEEGKVDVAFVCSGPYVTGHDEFGLQLLCAPQANGTATYRSYVIVPASSDATSMASLAGRRFAFTDPKSNTGRTVPVSMLKAMGTDPDRFFGKWFYTYGHDVSIRAVADGTADGASVDSLIWHYLDGTHPEITKRTRIIERSEPYAIPPVVVRPGLDDALVGRIRDAFLAAHEDPKGAALLEKMQIDRFVPIEDSAYDSIRAMQRSIEASGK